MLCHATAVASDKIVIKTTSSFHLKNINTILRYQGKEWNIAPFIDSALQSRLPVSAESKYLYVLTPSQQDIKRKKNSNIELLESESIEWSSALPTIIQPAMYSVNDPLYQYQSYLQEAGFPKIWEKVQRADSTVVIAIIDTEIAQFHPDLQDNLWRNSGEIERNGLDDDGNGFIDDIHGWDFGNNDNSTSAPPLRDGLYHGTQVAGVAAATGNNSIGIIGASPSARIMALKCATDNSAELGTRVHSAMLYAALMGAKVINCSWTGVSADPVSRAVVRDAIRLGAVVVAAAGNSAALADEREHAIPGLLLIGAHNGNSPATFSNFGVNVSLWAHGTALQTTFAKDTSYTVNSGTSVATPLVAGAVALFRTLFPLWTPEQVALHFRLSSVPFATIEKSSSHLFYGMLNLDSVFQVPNSAFVVPGLWCSEPILPDTTTAISFPTEVQFLVKNILKDGSRTKIALSSLDNKILCLDSVVWIDSLASEANITIGFRVKASPTLPLQIDGTPAQLLLTIISEGKTNYFLSQVPVRALPRQAKEIQASTFQSIPSGTFSAVDISDSQKLLIAMNEGQANSLYRLTTNGIDQIASDMFAGERIISVKSFSTGDAYILTKSVAGEGQVYYSADDGKTWNRIFRNDTLYSIEAFHCFSPTEAVLIGYPRFGNRTGWQGRKLLPDKRWQRITLPARRNYEEILSENTYGAELLISTSRGRILLCSLQGENLQWDSVEYRENAKIYAVEKLEEKRYRITVQTVDFAISLLETTDGGSSWNDVLRELEQDVVAPPNAIISQQESVFMHSEQEQKLFFQSRIQQKIMPITLVDDATDNKYTNIQAVAINTIDSDYLQIYYIASADSGIIVLQSLVSHNDIGEIVGVDNSLEQQKPLLQQHTDEISVIAQKERIYNVEVISMQGKVIQHLKADFGTERLQIPITHIGRGVYLVSVNNKYIYKVVL